MSVDPSLVEAIVFPELAWPWNAPEERTARAAKLISHGHAANQAGDTVAAAALFREASALEPGRCTSLISYLNMRLKLGDAELAVAAYLRTLEGRALSAKEMEHVRGKLREANKLLVETRDERDAASLITRVARGTTTRRGLAGRRRRIAAAVMIQRWMQRWLRAHGLGHAGLVSQVVLLRLPPPRPARPCAEPSATPESSLTTIPTIAASSPSSSCASPSAAAAAALSSSAASPAAAVVLCGCSDVREADEGIEPASLAPFAALSQPWSGAAHSGGALHFVVASRRGRPLYCCAVAFSEPDDERDEQAAASHLLAPTEVLVLVSRVYQPRAIAAAAFALLPLALLAAADDAPDLMRVARELIAQPPPRPTGLPHTVLCAGTSIALSLPVFAEAPVIDVYAWRNPPPPLPLPPAHVEPICEALATLGADTLIEVFTALLLERKLVLVSSRPGRLTPAACALLSLLFPFEWRHCVAPLLPPSHADLLGMPFPYLCGRVSAGSSGGGRNGGGRKGGRKSGGEDADDALVVYLDEGRLGGHRRLLAPLPEREKTILRRRLHAALGEGGRRPAGWGVHDAAEPASGSGGRAVDVAVQAACLGTLASLLAVCAGDDFTTLGHAHRRGAKLDAIDTEVSRLTALFVRRQPTEDARAFARGLAETAHFQQLLERLAQPRSLWPRRLAFFGAWIARANAEQPC